MTGRALLHLTDDHLEIWPAAETNDDGE